MASMILRSAGSSPPISGVSGGGAGTGIAIGHRGGGRPNAAFVRRGFLMVADLSEPAAQSKQGLRHDVTTSEGRRLRAWTAMMPPLPPVRQASRIALAGPTIAKGFSAPLATRLHRFDHVGLRLLLGHTDRREPTRSGVASDLHRHNSLTKAHQERSRSRGARVTPSKSNMALIRAAGVARKADINNLLRFLGMDRSPG